MHFKLLKHIHSIRGLHSTTTEMVGQFLLLFILLTSCSAQSVYYVTPTPDTPCPGKPCHTLSEYVAGKYFSNLPVNTTVTMEFLPGNHTLESTISVANLTRLTLHGNSSSLPEITSRIVCSWPAGFIFTNITELHISALAFISCGHDDSAAVSISIGQQSDVSYCTFQNSRNTNRRRKLPQPDKQGGALSVEDATLTLIRNTFQSNSADDGGSVYASNSTLNLTGNTFQKNSAQDRGTLHVRNSTINLTGNTFQNNSARVGGTLHVRNCTLNLTGNTFQNNSARFGGTLHVRNCTINLTGNTFQNNSARFGGTLHVRNSTLSLTGNTFQNNSARDGGTLNVKNSTLSLTGNTFQNNSPKNTPGSSKGALAIWYSILSLTGNTFQNNYAGDGGALYVWYSTLNLTGNTFQYNSADDGGLLYVSNSTLNLTGNTFQENSARVGGTLSVRDSTLNLTGNTFQNNSAEDGGSLYVSNSTLNLTGNTFKENSASVGGTLSVRDSTLNFTGNTFQNNSAEVGGSLYVSNSALNLTGNTFKENSAQDRGTLHVRNSTVNLTGNTFQYNSAKDGGSLYVSNSTLNLTGNTFQENSARTLSVRDSTLNLAGNTFQNHSIAGTLYVWNSILNLSGNIFQNNSAHYRGGVLDVWHSTLNLTGNIFQKNSAHVGGALYAQNSTLSLTGNTFQNTFSTIAPPASSKGALAIFYSILSLSGNTFQDNYAGDGGALYVWYSTLNLIGNTFQNNSAYPSNRHERFNSNAGGAVSVEYSNLSLTGNTFQNNSGRTLFIRYSNLNLTGNTFQHNFYKRSKSLFRLFLSFSGGAMIVEYSNLSLIGNTFHNNFAHVGGAMIVKYSNLNLTGNTFHNNSAHVGGAMIVEYSTLNLTGNTFQNNSAGLGGALNALHNTLKLTGNVFQSNSADFGGALRVWNNTLNLTGNTFQNNFADIGGALHVVISTLSLTRNAFQNNSAIFLGGAILANNITVKMYNVKMKNNRAQYGGGMAAVDSQLEMNKNTVYENNTASYGGGLYLHNTKFNGYAIFSTNFVTEGGGGIYASRSTLILGYNTTIILNNSARDGGGLLLSGGAQLYQQPDIAFHLIGNSAISTGGAIKVEESNPLSYCITTEEDLDLSGNNCFFQIQHKPQQLSRFDAFKRLVDSLNVTGTMYFENNSAVEAGADLYGGSVDNCILNNIRISPERYSTDSNLKALSGYLFDVITDSRSAIISSDPLHICTCENDQTNCSGSYYPKSVYPGGTLEVPVIALGQRNGTTTAVIQVIDHSNNIKLSSLEYSQSIDNTCNILRYTIVSNAVGTAQEITLYAQGPCSPTQTNSFTVTVNIQHCPPGFQLSMNEAICICAERLHRFTNTCSVDNKTVLREQNANFWVGYDSDNDTSGLILHPNCPFDYCTSEETYLAVDDSDKQCNYNRSGLLCGRCNRNLSLVLGSFRCLQCSNLYLSLLVAIALAGIVLVLLLLVLRLTVAAGTINGLVFYANIVAVNSVIFFQPQSSNVSTGLITTVFGVFIAWLNLDLGIETCFYNGMTAYVKTWLQFIFPLYVWTLVGMIIVGSHYSGRVARVFGRNPVAVLATLFLLSYAKLLRTVIAALSYTSLEYPNNTQVAVWLYDGNVKFLSGKHIPLFTAAMVCLIFLFLPYTMLLIFSQYLQSKPELKIFFRINSRYVKPFLDAYHAPYTSKHRYWTGLMLLVRLVLFLISAVNALGDPNINLLAIATTAILTAPTIVGCRIYKTWSLGLLETSFNLNLTILAVATLFISASGGNQNAVTFTSVGIAFATFTGIVIYHSVQQLKGTRLWRRVCMRHEHVKHPQTDADPRPGDPPDRVFISGSAPTQTVVDLRELREPCMATD